MRTFFLLLSLLLLVGCEAADLHDAEVKDSAVAYEAFLAKHPDSADAERLRGRIDDLRFTKAKADGTHEAMAEYLQHHPEGRHADDARREEDRLAYDAVKEEGTAEAVSAYLDAHPDGKFVEEARDLRNSIHYTPKMRVENVAWERTQMANDKEKADDGWRVTADVINGGDRTLAVVECAVDHLDDGGAVLRSDTWWAVAHDLGGFPTRPWMVPTLKAGETREFIFTTADMDAPPGFGGRFNVRVTDIRYRK